MSSLVSQSIRCEMCAQEITQRTIQNIIYDIAFYSGCRQFRGKDGPSPRNIAAGTTNCESSPFLTNLPDRIGTLMANIHQAERESLSKSAEAASLEVALQE